MVMFAPYMLEPHPFARYRSRCRPAFCKPAGCQPCFAGPLMGLLFMLVFSPCILRLLFSAMVIGLLVSTLYFVLFFVASSVGEFVDGCFSPEGWPCTSDKKPAMACGKQTKQNVFRTATPSHQSSVSASVDASTLTLTVSVPGVATSDLDVKLQAGDPPTLTIQGQTTVAGSRHSVDRTVSLPKDVDVVRAGAAHADGLLTVTLPRKVAQTKRIKIEASAPAGRSGSCARHSALLAQIRDGLTLKKTVGPPPRAEAPVATAVASEAESSNVEPSALAAVSESEDESGQWEVVKEQWAENIDAAILQEFEEMGFVDRALNAEMLAKHGSVKAAVKELVARRRAAKKDEASVVEAAG